MCCVGQKINLEDYDYDKSKIVGEGAFGKVILGKHKQTQHMVAIKQISQQQINELGKVRSIYREKDLLFELDHQFIIKLIGVTMD
jgi:serine/threonine protein kinase